MPNGFPDVERFLLQLNVLPLQRQQFSPVLQRAQRGQSKRVVKFAICEQSRIGGDSGAAKLQCEAAVKSSRRTPGSDSTTRVRHHCLPQSRISC